MKRLIVLLACMLTALTLTLTATADDSTPPQQGEPSAKPGGVKSLEERLRQLEEAVTRKTESDKWYDRLKIGGLVEIEAGHATVDYSDPTATDENITDVDLTDAELAVDAKIAAHVDGHVRLKWEPVNDEPVFLDEGFVTLIGSQHFPAYMIAGRQYVPFGNFESYFVSDPNTLVLGETNEGAVVVGYRFLDGRIDASAGAFNGKVHTAGSDNDINSFVAAVAVQPLEALNAGVSYTSNLAGSSALNEEVQDTDHLAGLVGAWSVFATYAFLDRFKLVGEYVATLDSFKAGELYDAADTRERQPSAWNVELGAALIENIELALRYGGADDGGPEFLPETQYGSVLNWGFFESTNLAIEYLHGEFENDAQKTDSLVAQLAIEF